jgi:hypothetical protein
MKNNEILDRVLLDIKKADASNVARAPHGSFVSGVFESQSNEVLDRVLGDIKKAEASNVARAPHGSFVSGVFES